MLLPGLLIEYLINGALALIWLIPILMRSGFFAKEFLPGLGSSIFLLAATLYLIGMVIDGFAWVTTKGIKKYIRKQHRLKMNIPLDVSSGSAYTRQAKFAIYAPDLSKESSMRSSRDRIARGAIVNSLLGTIAFMSTFSHVYLSLLIGLGFTISCFLMWVGFERVSYGFELAAESVLDNKLSKAEKLD